jgi:hypothetical protein
LVMLHLLAPAREPAAWIHAPPQPLVRSPLSRCQTPTAPRRAVGFFGFGCSAGCPAGHFARLTSDWPVLFCQPFQPSTHAKIKARRYHVNARFWCNCGNPADKSPTLNWKRSALFPVLTLKFGAAQHICVPFLHHRASISVGPKKTTGSPLTSTQVAAVRCSYGAG